MNLLKMSDSIYLRKYGTSDGGSRLLEKMKNMDFSKYIINDSSRDYLIGVIDRKISSDLKSEIIILLKNGTIELIACDKDDGIPNYMIMRPTMVAGKVKFYLNIGYYAKFDKSKRDIKDIDPRILFSLLVYGYAQYKIYTNPNKLTDIKFQDLVVQSYRKIINKVMAKIVSLNTLTFEEKLLSDIITYTYIYKVLLRKDDEATLSSIKNIYSKLQANSDRYSNILSSVEMKDINSFEEFVNYLSEKCPSFKKLSPALLLKEYTISMKSTAVLSIDLLQVFVPTLLAVDVGSSGVFNDKFVDGVLDQKETTNLKTLIARF